MEKIPEAVHTRRLAFTLPVYLRTPVGLTNMPEPIMEPTITVIPFNRDIFASSLISSLALSAIGTGSYGPFSSSLMLPGFDILPTTEPIKVSFFYFYKNWCTQIYHFVHKICIRPFLFIFLIFDILFLIFIVLAGRKYLLWLLGYRFFGI